MLYAPANSGTEGLHMSEFCDKAEDRGTFLDAAEANRAIVATEIIEFTACLIKQWEV